MEQKVVYLSAREVASMLSIKSQTLANWRFQRRNLPYSKIGRIIRYSQQDVIQFAESRKVRLNEN